jgi:AcrB/AcrD/AcrF family
VGQPCPVLRCGGGTTGTNVDDAWLITPKPFTYPPRPLAIVVIGGLVSSTALTLLLFPLVYAVFEGKEKRIR